MIPYVAEMIGTAILLLLGNGVVANVLLDRTKGHGAGWIAVTSGWAIAVFIAVASVSDLSGAHINPAVSIGLAVAGRFDWALVPGYCVAQVLGGIVGATVVWLFYRPYYEASDSADAKLATFCTAPNIRDLRSCFLAETVATFVLVFAVLRAASSGAQVGALGALPVALVVYGVGTSLGGPTGYAINPARDLGPRIAHAILPIPGKRDSDWGYAGIPIAGPILGALLAAGAQRLLAG